MRLKYSKLVEFVESSNGAYSLQTEGAKLSLIFLSKLDAAREHYEDAVIKIYGTKNDEYVEITGAEMVYGGGDVRKLNLETLVPWLMAVDDEASP
ncbi:hypothetical protein B9Q03_05625 [Candidatus Marsarchaeota G2 archaeon OSP_D]|jgi:hypothetical protein|uniref:Uncharacterized protein n=3 Tax=Candidatus Marsarchaeota group 2 TaxID=2203771 RepID=A0A2R6C7K0_9ARCH|nr:MAG: hypothetical protein B9Q03_05625 [Candidatus Marsarchaeota G2 archaeon OSP_D]PSN93791.1 MAG: hypothetical protein B9Q09_05155 [Candidatus Marsarchaeota G2 archaeon ECH_B_SAG-C16]PSO06830.1 MAG: hypothetical protein B9Q04_14045 [Candidatus Marsarchaeota G2 archaeon BE_D]